MAKGFPIIDIVTDPYPSNMKELAQNLEQFEKTLVQDELVELDGIIYKVTLKDIMEYPRYELL